MNTFIIQRNLIFGFYICQITCLLIPFEEKTAWIFFPHIWKLILFPNIWLHNWIDVWNQPNSTVLAQIKNVHLKLVLHFNFVNNMAFTIILSILGAVYRRLPSVLVLWVLLTIFLAGFQEFHDLDFSLLFCSYYFFCFN